MSISKVESAISLKNRTDPNVAAQLNLPILRPRSKLQRDSCWKLTHNTAFLDTICRGWLCSPIFIIEREPEEEDVPDELEDPTLEDHVFDGAHKLEAVFAFIDGTYAIAKMDEIELETSPLKDYIGKKFKDLPKTIQNTIKNYEFRLNYIDPACSNDPESLKILWKRLNNSGMQLNDFELAVPIIKDLLQNVLKPCRPLFLKTPMYVKDTSNRGECESLLQLLLALSESEITESHMAHFTCKKNLIKRWQAACLGTKMTDIKMKTEQNTEKWKQLLKKASDYMRYLEEANCFVDSETEAPLLQSATRKTELVFLLGRCVFHFPKPETFRRICGSVANDIKETYFKKIHRLKEGRNGILQREILRGVDAIVKKYKEDIPPRAFTKEQIEKKKVEQNSICALCKEKILSHHEYHGDHILAWSMGGDTSDSNLQICHRKCNLVKGKKLSIVSDRSSQEASST